MQLQARDLMASYPFATQWGIWCSKACFVISQSVLVSYLFELKATIVHTQMATLVQQAYTKFPVTSKSRLSLWCSTDASHFGLILHQNLLGHFDPLTLHCNTNLTTNSLSCSLLSDCQPLQELTGYHCLRPHPVPHHYIIKSIRDSWSLLQNVGIRLDK